MPTRRTGRLAVVLACAGLAATAPAAAASPCNLPPTSKVFAQFGDNADYYLAQGGDFEVLTWSIAGGAGLDPMNNPFNLSGKGLKSMEVEGGESTTSPAFCVSKDQPHLRLVALSEGRGDLVATVTTHAADGSKKTLATVIDDAAHTKWSPTVNVSLNTARMTSTEVAKATVSFSASSSTADWLIDDVFIDPYRR